MNSVLKREKTFLLDAEWLSKPWPEPESKPQFDHLIDIFLNISQLSAQDHALQNSEDSLDVLRVALQSIHTGLEMELRLDGWLAKLKTTVPGAMYRSELSKMSNEADNPEAGRVFTVAFWFPAPAIAITVVYYWVTSMCVSAHLCHLYEELSKFSAGLDAAGRNTFRCSCDGPHGACLRHFSMEQLPALGRRADWPRTTAYNIAQSAEYFMEQSSSDSSVCGEIVPALVMVQGFWKHSPGDWSREIDWVEDKICRIRNGRTGVTGTIRRAIKDDLTGYVTLHEFLHHYTVAAC
jgi:hypothetical protein